MSIVSTFDRLSLRQQAAWQALLERRFFKLIGGGSLTELSTLTALSEIYGQAGIDCIDIAPELAVINTVAAALDTIDCPTVSRPMLMISLPLDPDPHFRKIELKTHDCILCGACVPVCPTEAFTLSNTQLLLDQPLCYGCGRCTPLCPTDALVLHPFMVEADVRPVLTHPAVEAVELHTQHADPKMLQAFLTQYGPLLQDKLVAYCFRPDHTLTEFWLESINLLLTTLSRPVLLQIDGAPMSGSDNPKASLPALEAARQALPILQEFFGERCPPITISGGINQETSQYLAQPEYAFIAGVGMGTYARQWVWSLLEPGASSSISEEANAVRQARFLCTLFRSGRK